MTKAVPGGDGSGRSRDRRGKSASDDARLVSEALCALLLGLTGASDELVLDEALGLLRRVLDALPLTPACRAVAGPMALGAVNELIAQHRKASPHTVRTQAGLVFSKAKVTGRATFSALVLGRVLELAARETVRATSDRSGS